MSVEEESLAKEKDTSEIFDEESQHEEASEETSPAITQLMPVSVPASHENSSEETAQSSELNFDGESRRR